MKTFITTICAVLFVIVMVSNNNSYAQSISNRSIKFDSKNGQNATLVGDDGAIINTTDGGVTWQ